MNWKLIFALSLFGLAMGTATVYVVPSNVEPFCWLGIFIVCAIIIARVARGRYFLHGLMTSIVNSVWITAAHVLMYDAYIANHQKELEMMSKMNVSLSPKTMMLLTGPVVGVVSGVILGVFALVAAKLMKRPTPAVR